MSRPRLLSDEERLERKRAYSREWYHKNKERRRESNRAMRLIPNTRLNAVMSYAAKRAKEKDMQYDLDRGWIESLWKNQNKCCSVTGLPFDLHPSEYGKNPFAPSLDRIDSSKGYTKDNTQLVVYMYNTAKGDWGHEHVMKLVEALHGIHIKRGDERDS